MKNLFLNLAIFTVLVTLFACGKKSSGPGSNSHHSKIIGDEALVVKELLKSYQRHQLAIFEFGGDPQIEAMAAIIRKGFLDESCKPKTSQVGIRLDSIEGNNCAINWNGEIKSRIQNSQVFEGEFVHSYDVLTEDFRRLNDLDYYRITGEVKKHLEGRYQIFKKTKKGIIHSQLGGLISIEQYDDLKTSYMWMEDGEQRWWGTKSLVLKFSGWTANVLMKFDDLSAIYEVNGVEVTDDELRVLLRNF